MRHRSIVTYVVIVAVLAAVPQVSRELLSLKSAVGQRLRTEIWNAFLGLHAENSAELATQPRPFQAAAATARAEAKRAYSLLAQQTRKGRGGRDAAWREGALPNRRTRAAGEEARALIALAPDAGRELVTRLLSKNAKGLPLVAELSGDDFLALRGLQRLLPPVAPRAELMSRPLIRKTVREAGRAVSAARAKNEAFTFSTQFAERGPRARLTAGEVRNHLHLILKTGGESHVGGKVRVRAPRVKVTENLGAISSVVKAPCSRYELPVFKREPLKLPLASLAPAAE